VFIQGVADVLPDTPPLYPRCMPRRADPERIYQARRAASFAILTQTRAIDELDAEHWMARWEHEAERQGLDQFSADFWAAGRDWIAENRRKH
jgi:hypothetical protein